MDLQVGLAHVASGHEIMWSPNVPGATLRPDRNQTNYGSGDREGLAWLGSDSGCLPAR